ncbi:FMN-dependent NADPH-azoreductase [Falsiruegeria litorea R37]|uniref:FMN-dependent NADPH-azoreductase n=1 Tax=Falsiruegeria litorea R37 TaxID=1200284 RepID=A0A1Y5SA94_9RHOB|nr:NAD(P)H-dependent oxidoreductase [Falsiruegeria litorea]SLN33153.1 FMN-dependent NADPH-azoreductase [Falsiruegeria litorea R37]
MTTLVFLGSTRDSSPPRPRRLGARVATACARVLTEAGAAAELIDPLDYDFARRFKPHFAYAPSQVPAEMEALAQKIEAADSYVMVSPEYNHSMSPALADLLNHFGSSLFSYKPSTIVTYSAGQWGGARAAVNMRTYLSELGCLPISAMIHIPHAQDVLTPDGNFAEDVDADRWTGYFGRSFQQLLWWAAAAKSQHQVASPTEAFLTAPSQRNAP